MRGRRRPEYFFIAAITAIIAIVGAFMLGITLTNAGSPLGNRLNSDGKDIISRTSNLVKSSDDTTEQVIFRVGEGMYSVGDYMISVMTSPEYLVKGVDDQTFAMDLSTVLYGNVEDEYVEEMVEDLEDHTRMYVINKYASKESSSYKASSALDDGKGSGFSDIDVNAQFTNSEGYTIGIKEAKGSIRMDGEEVRTDFFVDNTLYRGYLNMESEANSDGKNEFTMAWDTAGVNTGEHQVYIFVRSSDGRGQVVAGGNIFVPSLMTLTKDAVSLGALFTERNCSWYIYDAGDSDAYVNFVGLTDDIKVSLYDAYGNIVGANDIPNSDYEVLRAHKQDLDAIAKETGIEGVSNVFYICVERGAEIKDPATDITYTMVQSPEVAYYSGEYMAVLSDITDADSDTSVSLRDLNLNTYDAEFSDVEILPINGYLTDLKLTNSDNGQTINLWPVFDNSYLTYAYYLDNPGNLVVRAHSQEGYASSMEVSSGALTFADGQAIPTVQGETEITVKVKSFSGVDREYKIYILNSDDEGTFKEDTLQKFPRSYYSGLWLLHKIHPDYVFEPYQTPMSFDDALQGESKGSRSLSQKSSHPEYIKSNSPVYDKPDWMAVKKEVVSYYLDPRNFLLEDRVFMFEQLSFNSEVHTVEGVQAIIAGSFMDTSEYDYAQIIFEAGRDSGVSPYFLASRIIQEMGYKGSSKLAHGTVDGYEGYYNFYNIGSTATTAEGGAVRNGAKYAQWGRKPDEKVITDEEAAILLPWDSPEKAIKGGALWIASGYIDAKQDTLYFQKFDLADNGTEFYQHQYAQNIQMAYSESRRYYKSYKSIDQLDNKFVFIIPVFSGMPDTYGSLPEA